MRALFSPSARGRAAEGGRGSLTHHLELELSNTDAPAGLASVRCVVMKFRRPKRACGCLYCMRMASRLAALFVLLFSH
jgi:hypothetical protein